MVPVLSLLSHVEGTYAPVKLNWFFYKGNYFSKNLRETEHFKKKGHLIRVRLRYIRMPSLADLKTREGYYFSFKQSQHYIVSNLIKRPFSILKSTTYVHI